MKAVHSLRRGAAEAMEAVAHTEALILDIRENGGGSSGWWVMRYLVEQYNLQMGEQR